MPENVMLNHNYVMAEGGTGVRALLAAHMYLSSKAYAAGENGRTENWKFIYAVSYTHLTLPTILRV